MLHEQNFTIYNGKQGLYVSWNSRCLMEVKKIEYFIPDFSYHLYAFKTMHL